MNTPSNYRIYYNCLDKDSKILKSGTIIAKKKYSEFEALAGTEDYLKKKVPGMVKMQCLRVQIETMLGYIPTGSKMSSKNWDEFFKGFWEAGK